ncbi:hypothetical protein B0H13DRAFT_2533647 [Mycena leptocephala]|nr:hypothetical protein B0H13DRAFT_2533647 [Mycena leptocephala]
MADSGLSSLTTAVEALKQQPQSTDKKTAFWTSYKTLADEFDKEFQRKYGNDLDTSLIFAGLFSAVSSAFIIQIQPELQPDPNTQALLGLLVQNIPGAALLSPPTGPTTIVIVAQSLLYFSLFSTLLAALLAVLGKQWLLHYDSVDERGTIEERGLERQRKFEGLRRWKFDVVMQIFPLLLQLSLLLFAAALAIHLWTIHRAIAGIVLGLTTLGFTLYVAMIISAVLSPDSPFQTSLSFVLTIILEEIPRPESLRRIGQTSWELINTAFDRLRILLTQCQSAFAGLMEAMKPLLPLFHDVQAGEAAPAEPTPLFGPPPPPSKAVNAVIWALETSTDPVMVHSAAVIVPELHWWPVNFDVRPSLKRLADAFESCFNGRDVHEGMGDRATVYVTAIGVLEMVTDTPQRTFDTWTFEPTVLRNANDDLRTIISFFRISRPLRSEEATMDRERVHDITNQWALRFTAAQDLPEQHLKAILRSFKVHNSSLGEFLLADFLFCVNSFFSPTMARDRSILDKSDYILLLTKLLFENLAKRFERPWDAQIADDILTKLAQFLQTARLHNYIGEDTRCRNAAYRLCATSRLPITTMISVLEVVRVEDWDSLDIRSGTQDVDWVYATLERLHDVRHRRVHLMSDLLLVLFICRPIRGKPNAASLRLILSSFHVPGPNKFRSRLKRLALRVFCHADHWFSDDELGPILEEASVWPSFARNGTAYYSILGEKLSNIPRWRSIISQDLPGWLAQYPTPNNGEEAIRFLIVLSRVWDADAAEAVKLGDEQALAMMFIALANTWERVDFSTPTGGMTHRLKSISRSRL